MSFHRVLAVLMLFSIIVFGAETDVPAEEASVEELKFSADEISHDQKTTMVYANGNVVLEYGDITLTAQRAQLDKESLDVVAEGDVIVKDAKSGAFWRSPSLQGNLNNKKLSFGVYRMNTPVWFGGGAAGQSDEEGTVHTQSVWLTTCELDEPHYCMKATSVKFTKEHTFLAKNVTLRFGNVPVFYFPVLWGTTDGSAGYIFKPGYSGKKGAYLRVGRIKRFEEGGEATAFVDLMSKRGIGVGSDMEISLPGKDFHAHLYGVLDNDAPETDDGYDRRFDSKDERYRVNAYYREELAPGMDVRLNLDLLSDISMLSDWFRHDYRDYYQPKNYLDFNFDSEYFSTGIGIRPRLNDFYSVVETLPEFRFEVPRIDIGHSPFQYESSTHIGYYSMKWRDFDRDRRDLIEDYFSGDEGIYEDPNDYESFRAHSQHFIYLPLSIGDFSKITPRAGIAATYYSRSSKEKMTTDDLARLMDVDDPDHPYSKTSIKNYDADGGDVMRLAYEFGAEWKSRIYSDWMDYSWKSMEISGLRHIIEPYINYTYAPEPSHDRDHLYYFDEIDRLDEQHFIRLGIDQRLITRHGDVNDSILRLQSYYDYHFIRDDEYDRHSGDLGNRLDIMPRRDLAFWTGVVYDTAETHLQRSEAGIRFGEEKEMNFSIKYIYRHDHLSRSVWSMGSSLADISGESGYNKKYFESTNTLNTSWFIPLNSITSLEVETEYDFEKGHLSEHKYLLHRRMHCWDIGGGIGWDNSDFEIMFMASLVAFPKLKLDLDF